MQTLWFAFFFSSICLEGLGRKYLPGIPASAFYFAKDAILLIGYFYFRPPPSVWQVGRYLYRGFGVVLFAAILWTVVEVLNPEQQSVALGLVGLRSYWLWWIAPFVLATILRSDEQRKRAFYVLIAITTGISVMAVLQFNAPPDSSLNLYSVVEGEQVYASDVMVVSETGRARVSGTFSFISGFADFTILIPTLLLSLGLETRDRRLRRLTLGATIIAAAVVPMSGSRTSILLGVVVLGITAWTAGLLFTRIGRRIMISAIAVIVVAVFAFPDAFLGVQSRFADTEETSTRLQGAATILPPVAMSVFDYPTTGIGTGMEQGANVRAAFHVSSQRYDTEQEYGRYLIELGPIGYLLVWTARLGLFAALLRAYAILKRAGKRGGAGAALSYAALTIPGNITFDHIFQALYFMGCGIILAEVVSVTKPEPVVQEVRSQPVRLVA
jgi:hypothetical protein